MQQRPFHPLSLLPSPVVCAIATLGPVGYLGKAPGTNGTVVGLLVYTLFFHHLSPVAYLLCLLALLALAVAFCGEAEKRMQKRDPGEVILDEVAVMPVCLFGMQPAIAALGGYAWIVLVAAFAFFRFFDILKPLGISKLQDLPGGWGVVADDFAAAIATLLCVHVTAHYAQAYLLA